MLIWRTADWRVESDGYISGQQVAQLEDLHALRRASMQIRAAETTRLAERARRARRRAVARGYAAGRAAALHDLVIPNAAASFVLAHIKERLVQIVMKAITEIVDELPPGTILTTQLRRSLQAASGHRLLSVRVAASDADDARRAIGRVEQEFGLSLVSVLADADLPANSCIVETDSSVIDGGLRHQLCALERGMRDAITTVLKEYTRMDDALLRQLDVVAYGLRDALDVLSSEPVTIVAPPKAKRGVKRKSTRRLPASSAKLEGAA
ncbi:FliH/SctL family protein [Paraburkholderia sacchari]|uniref:FliH/SctL family protein n=1 Tax=Paraburkholderia sacchari TaxID=159450 RepID=UPI003D9883B0